MLKVFKECCKNCLLSEDRIVSPKRAKDIIQNCVKEQMHFICHKASQEGKEIVCSKFYQTFGHRSQMVRIAERLGALKMVDQPESERLTSYSEMKLQYKQN